MQVYSDSPDQTVYLITEILDKIQSKSVGTINPDNALIKYIRYQIILWLQTSVLAKGVEWFSAALHMEKSVKGDIMRCSIILGHENLIHLR